MKVLDVPIPATHVETYTRGYDLMWCSDWEAKHELLQMLSAGDSCQPGDRCPTSDSTIKLMLRGLPHGARFVVETRTGVWSGECAPKDWRSIAEYVDVSEAAVEAVFESAMTALWWHLHRSAPPAGQPFSARKKRHPRRQAREAIRQSVRFRVFERDGYRCRACGASAADGATLHIDHIQPVAKGGTNDRENLQTLCADCNTGKRDRIVEAIP